MTMFPKREIQKLKRKIDKNIFKLNKGLFFILLYIFLVLRSNEIALLATSNKMTYIHARVVKNLLVIILNLLWTYDNLTSLELEINVLYIIRTQCEVTIVMSYKNISIYFYDNYFVLYINYLILFLFIINRNWYCINNRSHKRIRKV
jgi:hypothetical protein